MKKRKKLLWKKSKKNQIFWRIKPNISAAGININDLKNLLFFISKDLSLFKFGEITFDKTFEILWN